MNPRSLFNTSAPTFVLSLFLSHQALFHQGDVSGACSEESFRWGVGNAELSRAGTVGTAQVPGPCCPFKELEEESLALQRHSGSWPGLPMVLPKVLGEWQAGFIGRSEGRGEPGTVSALSSARPADASEPVQLSLTAGEMF